MTELLLTMEAHDLTDALRRLAELASTESASHEEELVPLDAALRHAASVVVPPGMYEIDLKRGPGDPIESHRADAAALPSLLLRLLPSLGDADITVAQVWADPPYDGDVSDGCDFHEIDEEKRCGAPVTDVAYDPDGIKAKSCSLHASVLSSENPSWGWEPYDAAYEEHLKREQQRLESTVKPAGLRVSTRYGSEGPEHDPYSFTEYSVTMPNGREIMLHVGLGEWLKVDGVIVDDLRSEVLDVTLEFEEIVGFPCDQLAWWADAPYRDVPCMACGREGCRGACCE